MSPTTPANVFEQLVADIATHYTLRNIEPPTLNQLPRVRMGVLPPSVFISYPQRPKLRDHDFKRAKPTLPAGYRLNSQVKHLGDEALTLSIGEAINDTEERAYSVVLQRTDQVRIYCMDYTIHNALYLSDNPIHTRYLDKDIDGLVADIEELVILAFYRNQYRDQLRHYAHGHEEIQRYLADGYVQHKFFKKIGEFAPITCFTCKEAKYVNRDVISGRTPCKACYASWLEKHRAQETDLT